MKNSHSILITLQFVALSFMAMLLFGVSGSLDKAHEDISALGTKTDAFASTTEDSIKSLSVVIINMYCKDYPSDINCNK